MSSNIPSAPSYGVYVSQLVCYTRACCNYEDFVDKGMLLTSKLLSQGYRRAKLVSTLKQFYGRHHDLVDPYSVVASDLVTDLMPIRLSITGHSFLTSYSFSRLCNHSYGHGGCIIMGR